MLRIPGKIPVTIQPFFIVLAALVGTFYSEKPAELIVWMIAVFISVLCHEFGHALTACAFGQKAAIELTMFGGLTRHYGKRLRPWQDFLLTLNGPMSGLMLFALAYHLTPFISPSNSLLNEFLGALVVINLFWSVFNFFPVLPLDGGYLLSIALEGAFGVKGYKFSIFFSMLLAGLLSVAFLTLNFFKIGRAHV